MSVPISAHDQGVDAKRNGIAMQAKDQRKPPRRTFAVLLVLVLIAIGLITLPRPTLYYANVVIEAADGMQLDFLLNGKQDKATCETAAAAISNTVTASCRECRTRSQTCTENLSAELRRRFDETPLTMASARMPNGVVTYSAKSGDTALIACRESEHVARQKGDQAKVACYPAGLARPHTIFEQQREEAGHTTFTLLVGFIGVVLVSLVAAIFIAYRRRVTLSPQQAALASHPWLEKLTFAGIDTLILVGTFLTLSWPSNEELTRWSRLDRATVMGHGVVVILTIGWFWLLLEHYARRRPFWDELREIMHVLSVMCMLSGAVAFVAGLEPGRTNHLIVWALNFLLIPLGRSGMRQLLDDLGLWQRPAVIVGSGENAREAYLAIQSERNMGYRIESFIDLGSRMGIETQNISIGGEAFPLINVKRPEDLPEEIQVIVALDSLTNPEDQVHIQNLLSNRRNVHVIPSIRGLPLFGMQVSHFFSHEVLFLTVRNNLSRRGYSVIKRAFDLVTATLLLVLLSPLFLAFSLQIRRDGGKAFYGHTRVGRNGKPFKCLKFRSMRSDADKVLKTLLENDPIARAEWDKDFKLKNDPRITSVGHFLRKTSLDELPQLFNVVKGEMSLVGPRPIVTAELERYGDYVNLYLQVLPGVTGLWQVSGRNDTSYAERVGLDAWYVQNWSIWYDAAILVKTISVVMQRKGAY